jgi:type VI secretion system Hcp family effector
MRRSIAMAITVFALCSSTLAAGDVNITIDSKQGQIRTSAKEFRYSQSPRDLAGQSTSMAAAGQATSGRNASAARAGMRRASEPIVIVRYVDETSKFFVGVAASGELLPAVLFEFKRTSGSGQPEIFQTVRLTNAIVSSVKTINGGDRPMEEVSFTFQKIEYNHKDGSAAAGDNWNTK